MRQQRLLAQQQSKKLGVLDLILFLTQPENSQTIIASFTLMAQMDLMMKT